MKEKLKVGQKLWLVPNRLPNNYAREITITKVGRKWATGDEVPFGHKIDAITWVPECRSGYAPTFALYESKSHYDSEIELNRARSLFKSNVNNNINAMTLTQIAAANKLLGFEAAKK
jgi:hypothetical protein